MDNKQASKKAKELIIFISNRESVCRECENSIEYQDFVMLAKRNEPVCLSCADLDHLLYLPAGNTALTRRARKHSTLSVVVVKFSKSRKRNERQGVLVESEALDKAEIECLGDAELREQRRRKEAVRRKKYDRIYIENFAKHIKELYPNCPKGIEVKIAQHACEKYSGRVGRSSEAKKFDRKMIELAVIAHIRHTETSYDSILAQCWDRRDARNLVRDKIDEVSSKWQGKS